MNAGRNLCGPCYRKDYAHRRRNGALTPSPALEERIRQAVTLHTDNGDTVYSIAEALQVTPRAARDYLTLGQIERPTLPELVALRRQHRISQARLADVMGVRPATVNAMEHRPRHRPTTVDRYREALLLLLSDRQDHTRAA
ncbi:hypothetical protein ABZ470_39875 [Streptosporangium sp. NPDC020072]|uniref:hypothetical protein n=1 Tax=Streptosporangium sp. NPDC020072 TaxID=3154788 RepID=UPI003414AB50